MKRWLILLAGILANLCQGAAYASSVFAVPMMMHLGLMIMKAGKPTPDMTKWALAFSMNLGMLPIGMLLSGRIADLKGPRPVVLVGGTIFGLGMLLAGFANTYLHFLLTFGVMMGIGSGMAYGAIVAAAVRWFPDRRGLASGLAVGALGFGPVVIVPVANALMGPAGPGQADTVGLAMRVLGVAFVVIMGLCSLAMTNPPKDYTVGMPAASGGTAPAAVSLSWTEMLGKSRFWLLYMLYVCGAFSGLMIISQAKPIFMGMKLEGLTPDQVKALAGGFVMAIAAANATGRVMWATVSDWIGRLWALTLMFLITAVTMFMMPQLSTGQGSLMVAGLLLGVCFGGYLGTFPALCADAFGPKNMAVNYALLFSGFSIAAIAGPYVAGAVKNASGNYAQSFVIAGIVSGVGFVLALNMSLSECKKVKTA